MAKKLAFIFLIFISIFSCSGPKTNLQEVIVEKYGEGTKKVVHYYEVKGNDSVWIRETWFYKEGMKHLDGPIVNGKRNGIFNSYYKSGNILSTGEFKEGRREGKATTFYEDGKVKYEGFYNKGKECGIWKFYDTEGNLYNEVNRDLQ